MDKNVFKQLAGAKTIAPYQALRIGILNELNKEVASHLPCARYVDEKCTYYRRAISTRDCYRCNRREG